MKIIPTINKLVLTLALTGIAHAGQVSSGSWHKKANTTRGSWSIEENQGQVTLQLKGLRTKGGPDLKIYLSPLSASAVGGRNATRGSLRVSALRSNKGDQTYTLPKGIDLSKYKSVVIHCEKFSKTWAAGAL